jgi:hypothetical protein
MPDPRVKHPTRPITMRMQVEVKDKLEALSVKLDLAQVQVVSKLVRESYKRNFKKESV